MAKAINRVSRPRPGPEWEVRQVEARTDWSSEVETCACCGASVDLTDPHVGADLDVMERDAREVREGPYTFTDCRAREGIDEVLDHVRDGVLFA